MSYLLSRGAANDLDEIHSYLAKHNLRASAELIKRLLATFRRLGETPGLGHLREDLTSAPYRFFGVGPYLVAYLTDDETSEVRIMRILHGNRNIREMLDT